MGKTFDAMPPKVLTFIAAQKMFFVATAPRDGHVNLSPKGLDTFRVLSPTRVAYLDLTGSGAETAAHLAENGRVTFMFCAFDGPPLIVRLYGAGRIVQPGEATWPELAGRFPPLPGIRSVVVAEIDRVSTSCGFGVPLMAFEGERRMLLDWAERKGEDALASYRDEKNRLSIDGLPTGIEPSGAGQAGIGQAGIGQAGAEA